MKNNGVLRTELHKVAQYKLNIQLSLFLGSQLGKTLTILRKNIKELGEI